MSIYNGEGEMDRRRQLSQHRASNQRHTSHTQHHQGYQGHVQMGYHSGRQSATQTTRWRETDHFGRRGTEKSIDEPPYHKDQRAADGVSKHQRILKELRHLLHQHKLDRSTDSAQTVREFNNAYDDMMRLVSGRHEDNMQIKHLQSEMKILEDKIKHSNKSMDKMRSDDLSYRLSSTMNAQLSKDETVFENVSIKDRPMTVASEYSTLHSSEWHAAKEDLDTKSRLNEEDKLNFLAQILKTAVDEATDLHRKLFRDLEMILAQPIKWLAHKSTGGGNTKSGVDVPVSLTNALSDYLRMTATNVDLTDLTQKIQVSDKFNRYEYRELMKSHNLLKYIQKCAHLAWKMVIQRPAMAFEFNDGVGKPYDTDTQDLMWGAINPKERHARVAFYALPALRHGNTILVKGKVWIKI